MSNHGSWQAAPEALSLQAREVQIWRVDVTEAQPQAAAMEGILAPEEAARAARFRFAHDRQRYVVTRAALRRLLGGVLSLPAKDVRLQYSAEGKPSLAEEYGSDVQFNVAHSHALALIALARGTALGVDVEHARQLDDATRVAQRFFSTQEVAALRALPAAQREATFFRIWARKEAFIKATGKGLSQPLGTFSVVAANGRALSRVEMDGAPTPWRLWDLPAGADYGAALVVWAETELPTLKQYQY